MTMFQCALCAENGHPPTRCPKLLGALAEIQKTQPDSSEEMRAILVKFGLDLEGAGGALPDGSPVYGRVVKQQS